eukprot:Lithocolla_globosa_v1_NODE_2130_length_2151_cov_211.295802.p2 type:complete len:110 gc:universal NODE_2130_length_2151_cov_211.295802:1815-1486(-)
MSLSDTDRRANVIASSKWSGLSSGTGSSYSSSMLASPRSLRSFSIRISFSIDSRMASLHARWQISVRSAAEKPGVTLDRYARSTLGSRGDLRRAARRISVRDPSSGSGM